MVTVLILLIILLLSVTLVFGSRALRRYWDEETNMSAEDHAFDRRITSYNTEVANTQRDEDIVRILRGRDMPTVADRYHTNSKDYYEEYEDKDEDKR